MNDSNQKLLKRHAVALRTTSCTVMAALIATMIPFGAIAQSAAGNAAGGAINYIAAKPTDDFEAKVEGTYARFDSREIDGYVSGPLGGGVGARLSFDSVRGGAWQQSYTRDDEIGATREDKLRLLLDWTPVDSLKVSLNLNTWVDQSDTPVTQL